MPAPRLATAKRRGTTQIELTGDHIDLTDARDASRCLRIVVDEQRVLQQRQAHLHEGQRLRDRVVDLGRHHLPLVHHGGAQVAGYDGFAGLGLVGGMAGGGRFQDALKLVTRLVNIGDAKSLACHPASTTHRQLGAEEMKKAGVSEDMVRLSIGIEHIDDIKADLEQALAAV